MFSIWSSGLVNKISAFQSEDHEFESHYGQKFSFLCRLRSIAAHRDHFVWGLSVCASVQ